MVHAAPLSQPACGREHGVAVGAAPVDAPSVLRTVVLLLALALPRLALAADGEVAVVASAAGAWAPSSGHGEAGGGLDLLIGVDESLWLEAGLTAAGPVPGEELRLGVWLGAVLMLDVLAWIPWVEVGGGWVSAAESELVPAARLGLGVDRLLDPNWFVGVLARAELAPRSGDGASDGSRILGGLRLGFRWEP